MVQDVAKGEKKDVVDKALFNDSYNPPSVEVGWDAWWEKQGYFSADAAAVAQDETTERFTMVIPPPNVTGTLHIGHALTCSIEDTLCRWHRMAGHHVMWLPGTDHAGTWGLLLCVL